MEKEFNFIQDVVLHPKPKGVLQFDKSIAELCVKTVQNGFKSTHLKVVKTEIK